MLEQEIEGLPVEQAAIELTASAERPEKVPRMCEIADQRLGPFDLGDGDGLLGAHAQRHKVIIGVIADPMTLGVSAFGKIASIAHLVPQHEEGRSHAMPPQRFEHLRSNVRIRTVIECKCYRIHWWSSLLKNVHALEQASRRAG